ncbi:glycosyltransferase [Vibrio hannami]|uniref:glycosyltransferase n=1 Tax=Vibrio hannami TaxID=2717094 RepID=UPI00240F6C11|nr:glycosyltransferase [Vibrio hannami]MDG3088253.1 glycosyltransferase [Vibrio hannami]
METHIDSTIKNKLLIFVKSLFKFYTIFLRYDIFHVHLSEPSSLVRKCFYIFPAFFARKKIIIHFHSFSPETTIKSRFKPLYYIVFKLSSKVVVLSPYWKKIVQNSLGGNIDVNVIYNPCMPVNTPILNFKENSILFAGTLNQRKGFVDLIKAFSNLKNSENWKLKFAGNGNIELGKQIARENGVEHNVEFLGWVKNEEKTANFSSASVFCLPSYAEGFPMAILDALAYELPIITSDVGGVPDLFEHGLNALIFKPGDLTMLTQNLEIIIGSKELRTKLAQNASMLKNKHFSKKVVNKAIIELYEEV